MLGHPKGSPRADKVKQMGWSCNTMGRVLAYAWPTWVSISSISSGPPESHQEWSLSTKAGVGPEHPQV